MVFGGLMGEADKREGVLYISPPPPVGPTRQAAASSSELRHRGVVWVAAEEIDSRGDDVQCAVQCRESNPAKAGPGPGAQDQDRLRLRLRPQAQARQITTLAAKKANQFVNNLAIVQ
jgi:hypothetical protein